MRAWISLSSLTGLCCIESSYPALKGVLPKSPEETSAKPAFFVAADVSRLHFPLIVYKIRADLRPLLHFCRGLLKGWAICCHFYVTSLLKDRYAIPSK